MLYGVIVGVLDELVTEVIDLVDVSRDPEDAVPEADELSVAAVGDEPEVSALGSNTSTPRLWTLRVGVALLEVPEVVAVIIVASTELVVAREVVESTIVVTTAEGEVAVADAGEKVTVDETKSELLPEIAAVVLDVPVVDDVTRTDVEVNVTVVGLASALVGLAELGGEVESGADGEEEAEPASRSSEAAWGVSSGVRGVNISVTF